MALQSIQYDRLFNAIYSNIRMQHACIQCNLYIRAQSTEHKSYRHYFMFALTVFVSIHQRLQLS